MNNNKSLPYQNFKTSGWETTFSFGVPQITKSKLSSCNTSLIQVAANTPPTEAFCEWNYNDCSIPKYTHWLKTC